MDADDVSLDSIEGTEYDELDPQAANNLEGSIFSGGSPDDTALTQDVEDEN